MANSIVIRPLLGPCLNWLISMKQIIVLGRGGQGAVTSSQIIAIAAFKDGLHSQAFPNFGVERTGAPVKSYARIGKEPITVRELVYEADYAIMLDPTLAKNFSEKVHKLLIINTNKKPEELGIHTSAEIKCVDITSVALKIIGKPFVNIASLGAFAALTGEVTLKGIEEAIHQQMGSKGTMVEKNINAIREVYALAGGKNNWKIWELMFMAKKEKVVAEKKEIVKSDSTKKTKEGIPLYKGAIIPEAGSSKKYKTGEWRTYKPTIDLAKCIKCGKCWIVCPDTAISKRAEDGKFEINHDYCKGCLLCVKECPVKCIPYVVEEK